MLPSSKSQVSAADSQKHDRLDQLQIKIRNIMIKNIGEARIVKSFKEHYLKLIQKMQEVLRDAKKQFDKDIKKATDQVQLEFKKLADQETRLQYLQNMK